MNSAKEFFQTEFIGKDMISDNVVIATVNTTLKGVRKLSLVFARENENSSLSLMCFTPYLTYILTVNFFK